ncbi:unnamed protein product, partial [Ectocarpus sp. 4 AP-2014]
FHNVRHNQGRAPGFVSSTGGGSTPGRRTAQGSGKGKNPRGPATKERPRCTYPSCHKPLGHTLATCFQKQRDERNAARARDRTETPK